MKKAVPAREVSGFRLRLRTLFPFCWRDLGVCIVILVLATLLCHFLRLFDKSDVFVALIFELAVVFVSRFTSGYLFGLLASVIGVFGIKPPTKDLNVTAALALMSICLIEYSGIHARGGKGFLKSLAAPTPIMTPMNILEIAIRPTSLCMRLFGNVLGAFVIMELIKLVVPVFVPAIFSLYFDLFDGLIQTYVFVFLTSLFMKESIGGEE